MSLTFALKKNSCYFKNLRKRLIELNNTSLEVGYFPQNGTHEGSGLTYPNLFAIHSFGSKTANIPTRPVLDLNFRLWNPINKNKDLKKMLKKYFSNIKSAKAPIKFSLVLDQVAGSYVQTTRASFGNTSLLAPNATFTIFLKGKNTPLIDTGDLRDTLSYTTSFRGSIVTP